MRARLIYEWLLSEGAEVAGRLKTDELMLDDTMVLGFRSIDRYLATFDCICCMPFHALHYS